MTTLDDLVVLVDEQGVPIGEQRKSEVHSSSTPRHLAFSLYLFNPLGQLLMTRRALTKVTWPGVWTNSCCGHPRPGEPMEAAVLRRLNTELGLEAVDLELALPTFSYRARDAGGVWENEFCPVFTATIAGDAVNADPDEVMDWAWSDWSAVVAAMSATPFAFSPWATTQVAQLDGGRRP